jgi:hypothetical protein
VEPCTKAGAELDSIRAAFVRTIWTQTRGVSDPARRACTDPDAGEAGSLTPLSAPVAFHQAARPAQSAGRSRLGHRRKPQQMLGFARGVPARGRSPGVVPSSPGRSSRGPMASRLWVPFIGPAFARPDVRGRPAGREKEGL